MLFVCLYAYESQGRGSLVGCRLWGCAESDTTEVTQQQQQHDYTEEVRNRFKGLNLVDRVPEELWTEVHNIVQEAVMKTVPKKNKCKEAKWQSEEALQIAEKIREVKSKGQIERYIQLNSELQRIASRDKKAFLSEQCKEIGDNNMGNTRAFFKKIRDAKGASHAKMGTIKDRNCKDLQSRGDY